MAAYVIVNVTVTDPTGFAEYSKGVPATVAKYGGRFLVRGGAHEVLEGEWRPSRLVVIEFPTREDLRRWYESEDYRPLLDLRKRTAKTDLLAVTGV